MKNGYQKKLIILGIVIVILIGFAAYTVYAKQFNNKEELCTRRPTMLTYQMEETIYAKIKDDKVLSFDTKLITYLEDKEEAKSLYEHMKKDKTLKVSIKKNTVISNKNEKQDEPITVEEFIQKMQSQGYKCDSKKSNDTNKPNDSNDIEGYRTAEIYNNGNNIGEIIETDYDLFKAVRDSGKISIIYIGRFDNCPNCVAYYPIIEGVSKEYNLDVHYINPDEWEGTIFYNFVAKIFDKFEGMPSTLIMFNGKEVASKKGQMKKEELVKFLKDYNLITN